MGSILIVSGPIGAGKSTVAKCLVARSSSPTVWIEGDDFWRFVDRGANPLGRRKNFELMMRSMVAAALPWASGGYDVVLDFSIPPSFLETLRKIVGGRDLRVDYVLVKPSLEVCISRAASRSEGVIQDYGVYAKFYDLFQSECTVSDDEASPEEIAARIEELVRSGAARV